MRPEGARDSAFLPLHRRFPCVCGPCCCHEAPGGSAFGELAGEVRPKGWVGTRGSCDGARGARQQVGASDGALLRFWAAAWRSREHWGGPTGGGLARSSHISANQSSTRHQQRPRDGDTRMTGSDCCPFGNFMRAALAPCASRRRGHAARTSPVHGRASASPS